MQNVPIFQTMRKRVIRWWWKAYKRSVTQRRKTDADNLHENSRKQNKSWWHTSYLAWGCDAMKSTAWLIEVILSASLSGISNPNSSSSAITTSTVSKLSNPRSFWKWAAGVTWKNENKRFKFVENWLKQLTWHIKHHFWYNNHFLQHIRYSLRP